LLLDLRHLKRRLEVDSEIDRTVSPELRGAATISGHGVTATASEATSTQVSGPRSASSAEYIVNQVKQHKRGAVVILAVLLLAGAATAFWYLNRTRAAPLTEKDTILLADFVNTTGDPVFDGTLKQALAVQLGQSPFLNIFGDDGVRETLRFMGRSPDERVTRDAGREICQRQGLKALLAGSISGLGSHYVITLEAINAQSGDTIAREQGEAEAKEEVLKRLGEAATKLREKLGESLVSIQKFDAPIEQATTSSLEAYKVYSIGLEQHLKGNYLEAIRFYKRATELDQNFAMAYARLAAVYFNTRQDSLMGEPARRAFDLRDRVGERERFYISWIYYDDWDKEFEVLELWKRMYPHDYVPFNSLALLDLRVGQFDKAVAEASESIRLNPNSAATRINLARAFLCLNRFAEGKETVRQAEVQGLEDLNLHAVLYRIGFIEGDTAAMKQQVAWAAGRPDEFYAPSWEAFSAECSGQSRGATAFYDRAVELAVQHNRGDLAAAYLSSEALAQSAVGHCNHIGDVIQRALTIAHGTEALINSANAFALCSDVSRAQHLVDELARSSPSRAVNAIWLPTIRGAIELNRNNPAQAIQLLQTAGRYEAGDNFQLWPAYIRGLAYMRAQDGTAAMAEFQKILDHRGLVAVSILYPLSYVGLARAAVQTGDTSKARKAYQDFFALWKDADADTPLLINAKQEYAQLK
jgi:tetratricopeptide (TPR) repeat protein